MNEIDVQVPRWGCAFHDEDVVLKKHGHGMCAEVTAAGEAEASASTSSSEAPSKAEADKAVKGIAGKFAPRASGNTGKNPAVVGSVLYDIFTYQAWICMALGGLLSYNVLFPSDQPDIWRLMGCALRPLTRPLNNGSSFTSWMAC